MKPAKLTKYEPEGALTILELAFYQNGGLDSKKDLDAGNAAVRASVEFLIKNKRVSKGFFVSLEAIAKAPNPIVIITETWAVFQLARIEEKARELREARIAAGLPAEEEPAPKARKSKKKKKKAVPELIDPNKPLTHGAVKWMKDALQNKQELIERRRKERMAQNGKLDHVAADPIVIDVSPITVVNISSHPSVARSATGTLQATQ